MPKTSESFRKAVREFLEIKEMSQSDLARALKMNPSLLSRYLRGDTVPSMDLLGPIAEALGVPVFSLLMSEAEREFWNEAVQRQIDEQRIDQMSPAELLLKMQRAVSELDQRVRPASKVEQLPKKKPG